MTREERAREVLATAFEAEGLVSSAAALRSTSPLENNHWARAGLAACLAYADAEAAAMRERAAGVASDIQVQMKESMQQRGISSDTLVSIVSMVQVADTLATAIRALPTTEVGNG